MYVVNMKRLFTSSVGQEQYSWPGIKTMDAVVAKFRNPLCYSCYYFRLFIFLSDRSSIDTNYLHICVYKLKL